MRLFIFLYGIPFLILVPSMSYAVIRIVQVGDWKAALRKRALLLITAVMAVTVAFVMVYFWAELKLVGTPLDSLVGLVDTLQVMTRVPLWYVILLSPVVAASLLQRTYKMRFYDWLGILLPIALYLGLHASLGFCGYDMRGRVIQYICVRTTLSTSNLTIAAAMATGLCAGSFDRRSHWIGVGFSSLAALAVAAYQSGAHA